MNASPQAQTLVGPAGLSNVAGNTADPMYLSSITIAVIPALCRSYSCYSPIDALRLRHPFHTFDIVDLSSSVTVDSASRVPGWLAPLLKQVKATIHTNREGTSVLHCPVDDLIREAQRKAVI